MTVDRVVVANLTEEATIANILKVNFETGSPVSEDLTPNSLDKSCYYRGEGPSKLD